MKLVKRFDLEDIRNIGEETIMRYYLGNFTLNKAFCNPLRKDHNPSMSVYYNDKGECKIVDYADSQYSGSILDLLMYHYTISLSQAIEKVGKDFQGNLLYYKSREVEEKIIKPKEYTIIEVQNKEFSEYDLEYWKSYNLSKQDLEQANIFSIDKFWITKNSKKRPGFKRTKERAFGYYFPEIDRWKLLMPDRGFEYKWTSNVPLNYIEGKEGILNYTKVILTKSRKDRIVLSKIFPNVLNSQNESTSFLIPENIEYLEQFKEVYIFFDADDPGIKNCKAILAKHNFKYINTPKYLLKYSIKDPAGWIAESGDNKGLIKFLIKKGIL